MSLMPRLIFETQIIIIDFPIVSPLLERIYGQRYYYIFGRSATKLKILLNKAGNKNSGNYGNVRNSSKIDRIFSNNFSRTAVIESNNRQ